MTRDQLIEMFRNMATEVAEKDFTGVQEESVIADLGVDSLAMLELVGGMERELGIHIPDDQLVGVVTVRQLLDVIEARASV